MAIYPMILEKNYEIPAQPLSLINTKPLEKKIPFFLPGNQSVISINLFNSTSTNAIRHNLVKRLYGHTLFELYKQFRLPNYFPEL